jgi:hypothetical protein
MQASVRIVLVLVLVLEKWGWVGEVLNYCAKSELHPPRRIGVADVFD